MYQIGMPQPAILTVLLCALLQLVTVLLLWSLLWLKILFSLLKVMLLATKGFITKWLNILSGNDHLLPHFSYLLDNVQPG